MSSFVLIDPSLLLDLWRFVGNSVKLQLRNCWNILYTTLSLLWYLCCAQCSSPPSEPKTGTDTHPIIWVSQMHDKNTKVFLSPYMSQWFPLLRYRSRGRDVVFSSLTNLPVPLLLTSGSVHMVCRKQQCGACPALQLVTKNFNLFKPAFLFNSLES